MNGLKDNDHWIAFYDSQKGGWLHRLVRRLTIRFWKDIVRAPINRMHERGLMSSRTYHEAHAYADRVMSARKPAQPANVRVSDGANVDKP